MEDPDTSKEDHLKNVVVCAKTPQNPFFQRFPGRPHWQQLGYSLFPLAVLTL